MTELEKLIGRQIDAALAQIPPPPPGYHYAAMVGDIVYNMDENAWRYEINFKLVPDDKEIIRQLQ